MEMERGKNLWGRIDTIEMNVLLGTWQNIEKETWDKVKLSLQEMW